jgi:PIN domain nuclease of toxin-antitoxin system
MSYWEVTIKSMKGSLEVGNSSDWWSKSLSNFSAISLNLLPEHIAEIHRLPAHHQDPFDRALIAQAIAEGLTILTTDRQVTGYASNRLQIIF